MANPLDITAMARFALQQRYPQATSFDIERLLATSNLSALNSLLTPTTFQPMMPQTQFIPNPVHMMLGPPNFRSLRPPSMPGLFNTGVDMESSRRPELTMQPPAMREPLSSPSTEKVADNRAQQSILQSFSERLKLEIAGK